MVVWCGIGAEDNLQAESNTPKPIYFPNQMVPRYRLVFCLISSIQYVKSAGTRQYRNTKGHPFSVRRWVPFFIPRKGGDAMIAVNAFHARDRPDK